MGDGSTPAIWSTRGGLRWSKTWEYKEEKPHYRRGSEYLEREITVYLRIVIVSERNI